jgi:uncharacterized DUF497 family protein
MVSSPRASAPSRRRSDAASESDPSIVEGEQRWQTIGTVGGVVLLIVAHTYRDDGDDEVIRIISARKATRKERRDYENG